MSLNVIRGPAGRGGGRGGGEGRGRGRGGGGGRGGKRGGYEAAFFYIYTLKLTFFLKFFFLSLPRFFIVVNIIIILYYFTFIKNSLTDKPRLLLISKGFLFIYIFFYLKFSNLTNFYFRSSFPFPSLSSLLPFPLSPFLSSLKSTFLSHHFHQSYILLPSYYFHFHL